MSNTSDHPPPMSAAADGSQRDVSPEEGEDADMKEAFVTLIHAGRICWYTNTDPYALDRQLEKIDKAVSQSIVKLLRSGKGTDSKEYKALDLLREAVKKMNPRSRRKYFRRGKVIDAVIEEYFGCITPPTRPTPPQQKARKDPVVVRRRPPFRVAESLSEWKKMHQEEPVPAIPVRLLAVHLKTRTMEVDWPEEGEMYGKQKALSYISQTLKHSVERGRLIRFMVEWGFVPSKTALCDLIKLADAGSPVGNDNWKKRGRPKKVVGCEAAPPAKRSKGQESPCNLLDDEEFAKRKQSKRDLGGWMGKLELCVSKVTVVKGRCTKTSECTHPKKMDVCVHLGYNNNPEGEGIISKSKGIAEKCTAAPTTRTRLYFNPQYFPPPSNIRRSFNHTCFDELRSYIKHQSQKAGSLVVCNGGGSKKNGHYFKQFVCANAYCKRKEREDVQCGRLKRCGRCPFGFKVRWDTLGYYIEIGNDGHKSSGWHCCEPVPTIYKDSAADVVKMRMMSDKSVEKLDMSVVSRRV